MELHLLLCYHEIQIVITEDLNAASPYQALQDNQYSKP